MGIGSFPRVKRPERGVDHSFPSSAEVKARVELYLYSPSGPSWPVIGWTLHLLYLTTVRPTVSGFPQLLHITVRYVPQVTIILLQFHWMWLFSHTFESSVSSTIDEVQSNKLEARGFCLTAVNHPSDQEITHDWVDPMLNTGITTVQHWTLILSQLKLFHTLTPCLFINRLHITLPSLVISSPRVFRLIFYRYFWSIPMSATSTSYIIFLNFMTRINLVKNTRCHVH